MSKFDGDKAIDLLERIASSLETLAHKHSEHRPELTDASAYIWHAESTSLKPVTHSDALPLEMLIGLDQHTKTLHQNTLQFAQGHSANNALLWGARGTGKSSLVKAIHAQINKDHPLILIEIYREDLGSLSALLDFLRSQQDKRFILFCDDLSFDEQETGYKSLKAILEGGIEGRPNHVLFYATSNRRHLLPRNMIENERSTAIHKSEAIEEKLSLSDRFGLWLGFYPCDQDQYLAIIDSYAKAYKLDLPKADLHHQALEWEKTRGARSGRVAWQFIQHIAGLQGKRP